MVNHPAGEYRAGLAELDGVRVDAAGDGARAVDRGQLLAYNCRGKAVLIHTGEHLTNLAALSAAGFRFSAVPPKLRPFATFPVRAYATW
jgi:hypothetical protein